MTRVAAGLFAVTLASVGCAVVMARLLEELDR